jgi:hypothetical protein
MTEVRIRDRYLSTLYRNLYAEWERGNQLGLQQLANDRAFPSTDPMSVEGQRAGGSPLGTGFARPAAETEKENG